MKPAMSAVFADLFTNDASGVLTIVTTHTQRAIACRR